MSDLEHYLAPLSHLLFANRNLDIVLLCFILFGVAIYALNNRWRANRLERELTASRSNVTSAPAGRRYANAPTVEENEQEAGGLPPIKGGRTYARNLGSALQKAGMSGPQIYSPPTPSGFTPNTNPMQPAVGQPGTSQPYAPPGAPWANPPAPPAAPWGFPGAGRNAPGTMPSGAPYYAPQPSSPPPQLPSGFPSQPTPMVGMPGGYPSQPGAFPPQPSGPFAPPPFGPPTSGPAAPAPVFAPPGASPMVSQPGAPVPTMPGFPMPGLGQPATPPDPPDGGRRGKPKRRRFNFNVLENLEKMVQARPAEAPPITGWTPPATPTPPATGTPAPLPAPATAPSTPLATPQWLAASPTKGDDEIPTLPFGETAGKSAEAAPGKAPSSPQDVIEEGTSEPFISAADSSAITEDVSEAEPASTEPSAVVPAAPQAESEPEGSHSSRRSMRSMMFGEEIAGRAHSRTEEPAPAAFGADESGETAETLVETPADAGETTQRDEASRTPYPWEQRSDATASVDPDDAKVDEPVVSETEQDEEPKPTTDSWATSSESEPFSFGSDADWHEQAEPVASEPAMAESQALLGGTSEEDDASGTGAAKHGNKPSAGTLVIIEDDQTAASYYETLFRSNGYQVEVANDGVSGVDLCAKVQPQVILLDVMMPRQNGILVLQTLRASDETKNTPVVVMSNFSEPTLIKRALQLGALEYVIKTQVEGPALLSALPRWINREKAFAAA